MKQTLFWLIGLTAVLFACQPTPAANVVAARTTAVPAVQFATPQTDNPPAMQPAVVYTVAAPEGVNPAPGRPPAQPTAWPTVTPADTPTPLPAATFPTMTATGTAPEDQPSATPSPAPTFTRPAQLVVSDGDHYWLNRPVPQGSAVWTDKAYPYGGTRGGTLRPHHGVEFNVSANTPILAAADGTVVVAGDDSLTAYGESTNFYGNLVVIEHAFRLEGQPIYTLYGHLSTITATVGQPVIAGETIALSGASGLADGPHLHFEVRLGQNSYASTRNPLLWLYPFPDRGTIAGLVTWPGGEPAQEVPVSARRIDAPSNYAATTTYAGNSVNSDAHWGENFALDDLAAGYYEVSVNAGDHKHKTTLWVYPYRTSFVTITLDAAP